MSSITQPGYKFESKNCTVVVLLSNGRSVSECYFCYQPLVNGRPPENIWRGVRNKNAPGAKWQPDGSGGFVSEDKRYSTWFSTKYLDQNCTCVIGVRKQSAFGEDAPVAEQADYARRHEAVMSGMRQWGQNATREQGLASAVKAHATGDVEPLISTYRAMGLSEEYIKGFREGVRLNEAGSTR